MRSSAALSILMLLGVSAMPATRGSDASAEPKHGAVAISATVTGQDQGVGFRAMVMRQAIQYNLAGHAENEADGVVEFTLQGRQDRIDQALSTIRQGTRKSSDIKVGTVPAPVDPALRSFTVIDWTSRSRNIVTPYTLVFTLRNGDKPISRSDAKLEWHSILAATLKGDDLKKLAKED